MRRFASLVICLSLTTWAFSQTPATQPGDTTDPLLGKLFRSRIDGIQFNPPAGGAMIRELNTGEIVRFVYTDESWDVRAKPIPLHVPLQLSSPPDAGLLELTVGHLTDSNPTAVVLRKDVASIHGKDVARIEATYIAGTDHIFAQQAIFEDTQQHYLSVQMTSKDQANENVRSRTVFEHMLDSVQILDRQELVKEQQRRLYSTRLWLLLDQKAVMSALEPLHFMRIVRDGRDVGFIQVNERPATHNGNDGIEVIIHSRVQVEDKSESPAPVAAAAPVESNGIVVPKPIGPAIGPATQPAQAHDLYTSSTFFMTFDRAHEDWTSITQTDEQVASQLTESAYMDRTVKRKFRPATQKTPDGQTVIPQEIPRMTLEVSYSVGKQEQRPTEDDVPPFYLPQALGQLMPRLLPRDPGQYMFAFYVSSQRNLMSRYVDVEASRDVELDGQTVRAIPISDRIGVDGIPTTHYITRQGEWLGSISDDGKLQVFPTDERTLKGLWPGFAVCPEPPANPDAAPLISGPDSLEKRQVPGDDGR